MWQIRVNTDKSRGGFQDRDVGRSNFHDDNYGPEHGVDFARFSDPPDPVQDNQLLLKIEAELDSISDFFNRGILVRNGFVFLKGTVTDPELRERIASVVRELPGVAEVQNHIVIETRH